MLVAALVAVSTVASVVDAPTAWAGCQQSSSKSGGSGGKKYGSNAGSNCPNADPPPDAPKKSTYCDGVKDEEFPEVVLTPASESMELYRYPDGREDTYNWAPYATQTKDVKIEKTDFPAIVKEVVNTGDAPTYEWFVISCTGTAPDGTKLIQKSDSVWVPTMTPEGVLERNSLFAEVVAELKDPTITFVDSDAEHGWLWVQVPHKASIAQPDPVEKSQTDTDPSGWASPSSVTAWIRAEPVAFSIQVQAEGGEKFLGSCDLATVTSGKGCKIQFEHSSSIAKDGVFYGSATLEWQITSNAGTFDDIGPITTISGFSVEVAEAMAVSDG